eukprot:Sspe_Gene.95061::Locus_67399_Transcript_1_1_Confidence_1.000_Length_337::g.95061::m.95061
MFPHSLSAHPRSRKGPWFLLKKGKAITPTDLRPTAVEREPFSSTLHFSLGPPPSPSPCRLPAQYSLCVFVWVAQSSVPPPPTPVPGVDILDEEKGGEER